MSPRIHPLAILLVLLTFPVRGFAHQHGDFYTYVVEDGIVIAQYVGTDETVVIPSELGGLPVLAVGPFAFQYSEVLEVQVPSSVKEIMTQAFAGCWKLQGISFAEGLEKIASEAFTGSALQSVSFPESLISLGDSAFASCHALSSIHFPANIPHLGSQIFIDCDALIEITFPAGFKSISEGMFSSCRDLQTVELNDDLQSIASEAFAWCENLSSVEFPDTLTSIGDGAFVGSGLTSIVIPSSVEALGNNPFAFSKKLLAIEVAPANAFFTGIDGVLYDKAIVTLIAYPAARDFEEFDVPSSVEIIGNSSFASSRNLVALSVPAATSTISQYAFHANVNLAAILVHPDNLSYASIDGVLFDKNIQRLIYFPYGKVASFYRIPPGVTAIEQRAFSSVTGIKYIVIPEGVTRIERDTFSHSSLTAIVVPSSMETIESYALNTRNLRNVYFLGDAPVAKTGAFYHSPPNQTYAKAMIFDNAQGFGASTWNYAYPAALPVERMGPAESSTIWKLSHGVPYDADMETDLFGGGHPLLLPFALDLPPQMNGFPMPSADDTYWYWDFYGGRQNITYIVETTSSLANGTWTTDGVNLSSPDSNGFRRASGPLVKPRQFFRVRVVEIQSLE